MKKILLTFSMITALLSSSLAQVSNYIFNQSSGTYSEISGGTVHGTTTNDDNRFEAINIGFTFKFNNVDYTQLSINTNGFIQMGATVFQTSNYAVSSSSTPNAIAVLSRDLKGKTTGSELMSILEGSAPNRIFTIQWKNYKFYGAADADCNLNFKIRLHETSNKIELIYGSFVQSSTEKACEVGIKGSANTDFNNRSTTNNWNATVAGTSNSATCTVNSTVKPSSGLTFSWQPAGVEPPASATVISPVNNAIDVYPGSLLKWTSGGGVVTGYKLFIGKTNPPTDSSDLTLVTNNTPTLDFGSTYYWMIKPYNTNGTQNNVPVWNFYTIAKIALPYSQNFDNVITPALPIGWSKIIYHPMGNTEPYINTSALSYYSLPNCVIFRNSSQPSGETKLMLIAPPTDTALNLTRIRFYALAPSGNSNLEVGTMSNPLDTNSYTMFQSISLSNEFVQYTVDFSTYVGTSKYIVFKHASTSSPNDLIYLDNVNFEKIPTGSLASINPSLFDFGSINTYTTSVAQEFEIKNVGVSPLIINSANDIKIVGADSLNFNLVLAPNFVFPTSLNTDSLRTLTVSFTPTVAKSYSVNLKIVANDGEHLIPLTGVGIGSGIISTFPYNENFDASNGGYTPFAISGTNQWEWGEPNKATYLDNAHSDYKAWVTKLTPVLFPSGLNPLYDHNSNCYLLSPVFDFTSLTSPKLSVWLFIRTDKDISNQAGWDAMILESSIDNGLTWQKVEGDAGFYNYSGSNGSSLTSPKWAGQANSWVQYTTSLGGLQNQTKVLFRFHFISDNNGYREEGIGIDDISIYDGNAPTITTTTVSGSPFNVTNNAASGTVSYTINGVYNNGNVFKAFLSDKNGLFATENEIGNLTSTANGTINITIPQGLDAGSNYKIRVKSTNPVIVGSESAVFEILNSTSILEGSSNEFKVYPNPAKGVVYLSSNTIINNVKIIDITGKTVKSFNFNNNNVSVPLSNIEQGYYFLQINTDKGIKTQKLQIVTE